MGFYQGELELDQLLESIGIGTHGGWEPGYQCRMPKQREFMADQHFGCAFVGGEGCIAAETLIGGIPIAEWRGGEVGDRYAGPAFLKGRTSLYRVSTRSRKQVVVTSEHRFLTPIGWRPLSSLHVGALIAADDAEHGGFDSGRPPYSPGRCSTDFRQDGELLPPGQAAFLRKSRLFHNSDGASSAWSSFVRLSTVNYEHQQAQSISSGRHGGEGRGAPLPRLEHSDNRRECPSVFHPLDNESLSPRKAFLSQVGEPSSNTSSVGSSTFRHYVAYPYIDSFWDEVQDISFVRYGDFYDLTVPGLAHYSAQGLWHHNSSKTVSLMGMCIINSMADANGITLVGRLNLPALTATTMQTFLELVESDNGEPSGLNGNTPMWTFPNSHKVLFRHLDISDPKVVGHIKSLNLSAAFVDEQSEIREEVFFLIVGRLRRKHAVRRIYRGSSNPAGHDWQWRTFFDPNRKAELKRDYYGITSSSMENVHLPPEYHARRLALYPPDWADRFIYGHFSDFTDLVYKEFTEPSHVWDDSVEWPVFGGRTNPPLDWPVIIGIDIGGGEEGDPWAIGLISIAPNGYLYKFAEVYGSDLRIAPIAEQIWSHLEGRCIEGLAYDYAQRAAAVELEDYNLAGTPAVKEVKPGLLKMAQYLHIDPRYIHPFNPAIEGSPKFFTAKSCVNTVREYAGYKWAKDRSGNPKNEPSHENSHSPDSDRYAVHTFRPLPQEVKEPKKWERPDLPIMSKLYWQKREQQEERQKQMVRLSRTPFFSVRNALQQRQMDKLHRARVV